jgi:hypothetical protein
MKNFLVILFLVNFSFSQNEDLFVGKIKIENSNLDGISVLNLNKKTIVLTDKNGDFRINCQLNDTIVFSGLTIEKQTIIVKNFNDNTIVLKTKTNKIETVVVVKSDITAESLGLVPPNQKRYTTAQRRLKTASDADFKIGLGFSGSLDPLINRLSGRTKMLENDLKIEGKERTIEKISKTIERQKITEMFKIPEEYINGFLFYLADDAEIAAAVKIKNNDLIIFRMTNLATEYLKLKNIVPLEKQTQTNEIESK